MIVLYRGERYQLISTCVPIRFAGYVILQRVSDGLIQWALKGEVMYEES